MGLSFFGFTMPGSRLSRESREKKTDTGESSESPIERPMDYKRSLASVQGRQVAAALAVVCAALAVCAIALTLRNSSPGKSVLVADKDGNEFRSKWKNWLGKVETQVDAALHVSHRITAEKREQLNQILRHDLVSRRCRSHLAKQQFRQPETDTRWFCCRQKMYKRSLAWVPSKSENLLRARPSQWRTSLKQSRLLCTSRSAELIVSSIRCLVQ